MGVTFGTELLGALAMLPILLPKYGGYGVFMAVFHSISAYCNAGFDLLASPLPGGSLSGVRDNYPLMTILTLLIISGGLGFTVWQDLLNWWKRRTLRFHTRIVLIGTAALLALGTAVFLIGEWRNPDTLGTMSPPAKLFHAFFQSVTCRTAGFTAYDQGKLSTGSKLFAVLLMFIGAAPGSTGGGVKLTTVLVLFMTVVSVIRGDSDTKILGRRIDKSLIYRSMSVCFLGLCIVLTTAGVLMNRSGAGAVDALYEAVSGFATVGLTAGVTGYADSWSQIALILTMFMGRVGPVAFFMALATRPQTPASRLRRDPEGKIWVA
jgi:trk system potassium uptake protein TrkH